MFHATRGPEIFACGNLAAFRLTMIYLPQGLLLKWVVVKYSGVPLQGGFDEDSFKNARLHYAREDRL